MDLTVLNNYNLDSCGKPIITLSAAGDCGESSFLVPINPGAISGELVPDSGPTREDKYAAKVNVRACIVRMPREITRQISFNCRTQRVETAIKYRIQGYDSFTTEKMDEVERIFLGRKIWVNGVEVQFEGGNVFEPLGQNFPNQYRLNVEVTECPTRITYGCGNTVNCGPPKWTFVIPQGALSTDRYFNSNNQVVASDFDTLLQYYKGLPGAADVKEVTADYSGQCTFDRAFEVTTYDVIPDSFFVGQISPINRVFGRRLDIEADFCQGLPVASKCATPVLGIPVVEDTACAAPVLGTPIIESEACAIELQNGWIDLVGGTTIKSVNGDTQMSITVQKMGLTPTPVNEYDEVVYTDGFGEPICYWQSDDLAGRNVYDIESVLIDNVAVDSTLYIFDSVMGSISFLDPCPIPASDLRVIFRAGQTAVDIIVDQTIARISQSCAPATTYVADAIDFNPAMPEDGTITVTIEGDVIYNGPVIVDPTTLGIVSKIELFNLTFENV